MHAAPCGGAANPSPVFSDLGMTPPHQRQLFEDGAAVHPHVRLLREVHDILEASGAGEMRANATRAGGAEAHPGRTPFLAHCLLTTDAYTLIL